MNPLTPEQSKQRRDDLMSIQNNKKKLRKVLWIALSGAVCGCVAMALIIGMQIDYIRSPILIQTQSAIVWRQKAVTVTPTPMPQVTPTPMPQVTPTPMPKKVSILNNIRMDVEQRQNAELIRDAFPDDAQRMIAIAMAESGLRCGSINHQDSNGVQAVGLFQINDGRLFDAQDIANLTDCEHNIVRAKQKYNSQGLTAWGAYVNKSYQKYL